MDDARPVNSLGVNEGRLLHGENRSDPNRIVEPPPAQMSSRSREAIEHLRGLVDSAQVRLPTPISVSIDTVSVGMPIGTVAPERPTSIYWRQLDIVNVGDLKTTPIVVIGAGSVGSFTVLSLAKMGAENITVYDDDKVEPHNLPNQFYRMTDVGKRKVVALKRIVKDFTGIEIKTIASKYEAQALQGIVLITVDTMASRKLIWNKAKLNPMVKLYVDSRMGAQVYDIQSFRPTDKDAIEYYERTWFDDEDAVQERCSDKAIIYTVMLMANMLCNMVKRQVQGQPIPIHITGDCVTFTQIVEETPLAMEEPDDEEKKEMDGHRILTVDASQYIRHIRPRPVLDEDTPQREDMRMVTPDWGAVSSDWVHPATSSELSVATGTAETVV